MNSSEITIDYLRSLGSKPRFHGVGFFQIYLSYDQRFHVWHPDFPATVHNAKFHDHKFHLYSEIVLGAITNQVVEYEEDLDGDTTLWELPFVGEKQDREFQINSHGKIVNEDSHTFEVDQAYIVQRGTIHTSSATELSATIMTKTAEIEVGPKVLTPRGEQPEHAFLHDVTEDDCWMALADATREMEIEE